MQPAEYAALDATALAALIRRREVAPGDVLEAGLAQIDHENGRLNAIVTDLRDDAHLAIRKGLPDGPFCGVPVLIKDVETDIAGVPTTNCSRLFVSNVARADSEIVRRLRAAGMVIVGKSNAPEFAYSATTEPELFGATRNPWNATRSTGGSSGGAACAVSGGMVPIAHATDGGGSTRIPAAFCGLVGLKPSRGRFSGASTGRGGLLVDGCVAKSVRDCAGFLDVISSPGIGDPYTAPRTDGTFFDACAVEPGPLKIALVLEFRDHLDLDPEWRSATEQAARLCAELGHHVALVTLPVSLEALLDIAGTIVPANLAALVTKYLATHERVLRDDDLEPLTHAAVRRGGQCRASDYVLAQEHAVAIGRLLGEFHRTYDVILSPTSNYPAPMLGQFDRTHLPTDGAHAKYVSTFVRPFNVSGQPAISLPFGFADNGMPIGIQLAAKYGDDALLFRLASQIERTQKWPTRPAEPVGQ